MGTRNWRARASWKANQPRLRAALLLRCWLGGICKYPAIAERVQARKGEIDRSDGAALVNTDVRALGFAPRGRTLVAIAVGGTGQNPDLSENPPLEPLLPGRLRLSDAARGGWLGMRVEWRVFNPPSTQ
ncbi:MAG: hypothetical protein HIU89_09930 [Proteobacteria bacterium]|nr:hypothetical protein [Pseudomonadota bacterium]